MKKKILIAVIALVVAFSPLVQPAPTAYAQLITNDPPTLFELIWKDIIQPPLIATLKKQILDKFIDQILTYVQGGGKPQFVTDWQGFLVDAGDAAGGEFIRNVGNGKFGFLCSPFNLKLQIALFPVKDFSGQVQCTLSQVVNNIQAFYGDFRNGGWIAYGSSWMPQNNFLGSLLIASEQLGIVKGNAISKQYNEAMAGNGFLGGKDTNGNIITPGSAVGDLTAKALSLGIDDVLSGQEIGNYAASLVNALLNRALTEGLSAVKHPSSSQAGIDAANRAYENSVVNQGFNSVRTAVLGTIRGTHGPRLQAQSLIDSTITNLNKFKTDLQQISANLAATGRSVCGANTVVATVQSQIAADIAAVDPAIAQLQTERAENRLILDPLDAAVNEINAMTPSRKAINRMDELNFEVAQLIDNDAADAFLASTQTETSPINANIAAKTATYNQQLNLCQL